jgi:hypothetical protein
VTRRERRERQRQEARRRRREHLKRAVPAVCLLAGGALVVAGGALAAAPAPTVAGSANGVPLASASTMAALAAGWQPAEPVVTSVSRPAEVPATQPAPPQPAPAQPQPTQPQPAEPVAPPVAVEIARIGVSSDLIDLDLDDDHRLEVPADPALAGWYVRGSRPGEPGPAVIVGHVDSRRGPAVFHRLGELEAGDEVVVRRADGSQARFVVKRLERWPKDAFPTDAVYEGTKGAELRLITCGGAFDRRARRYEDNIIVFATALETPIDRRTPRPS